MPQVVTHILVPLILLALYKDWHDSKNKEKFSLRYVLIAGLGGILPDLDVAAFWVLNFFGFTFNEIHRTLAHSLTIPAALLILFFLIPASAQTKIKKLKWNILFLMLAIGSFLHILLDGILSGTVMLFFPFSHFEFGLNLFGYLPSALQNIAAPSLDGALMILWIVYLEWKHKISDFI